MSNATPIGAPRQLERIASALLPPSKREQVLGDLAERFETGTSSSTTSYLRDVLQVVLPITWRAFWRMEQARPTLAASLQQVDTVRRRAEQVQDEVWQRRTVRALFLACMWTLAFAPAEWSASKGWTAEFYVLLCISCVIFYEQYCKPSSPGRPRLPLAIPTDISLTELASLHRRALLIQKPSWQIDGLSFVACLLRLTDASGPWTAIATVLFFLYVALSTYFGFAGFWAVATGQPLRQFRIQEEITALDAQHRDLTE